MNYTFLSDLGAKQNYNLNSVWLNEIQKLIPFCVLRIEEGARFYENLQSCDFHFYLTFYPITQDFAEQWTKKKLKKKKFLKHVESLYDPVTDLKK